MTQPTADGQHQQRGVDQALNDHFVAAWHVVDSKLRLELSKEQLDFPAHRVDRRDCFCGYRIGAGDVDAMPSGLGVPARNHSERDMLLPKIALSDVAKDVVDDDFERATTLCSEQVLGLSADHRRIVRRYDGPVGIVTNRANKITAGFDYVAKNVAVKVGQVEQAETPFAPGSNGEQPRVVCRSGASRSSIGTRCAPLATTWSFTLALV